MEAEPTAHKMRLMVMLRRLIREEFSVTIHLHEAEAVEELAAFAGGSRCSMTRQLGRELERLACTSGAAVETAAGPAGRPSREAETPDQVAEPERSPQPKRIYRGRVIG